MVQLSYPYMTTGKTIALAIWIFVSKVMSLLFNMLSRFAIAFFPRSKHLLISWLQSPSAVILESKEIKSVTVFTFFPFCLPWSDGARCHDLSFFECWVLSQLFHCPLSLSSRGSLVPLHFLPLEWYHLHIWGCWCFSEESWFQQDWQYMTGWQYTTLSLQSIVLCPVLTLASWPSYRFLRRQVRRSGTSMPLRIFHSCDPQKDFCSQWSKSRHFFLEFSCFFYDPVDVGNLISGFSAFTKPSL